MKRFWIKILVVLLLFKGNYLRAEEQYPKFVIDTCLNNTTERVYVHLSQREFVSGQRMFYKAYLFNPENAGDEASTILYLDIVNAKGTVVASWKSDLVNASGSGQKVIPDTLSTGVYFLRSYTSWMLNFGNAFIFEKPVFITNIKQPDADEIFSLNKDAAGSAQRDSGAVNLQATLLNEKIAVSFFNPWPDTDLKLTIVFNGHIIHKYEAKIQANKFTVPIKSSRSGIYYLVVTSESNRILDQQIVYYKTKSQPLVSIGSLKEAYKPREQIEISFTSNDDGSVSGGKYSCSVSRDYELDFMNDFPDLDEYASLYNYLSVGSWLPSYEKDKTASAINWQRTIWGASSGEAVDACLFVKEKGAMLLAGKVLLKANKLPVTSGVITLSINDSVPQVKFAITDNNGEFRFWLDKVFNNKQLHLKLESDSLKNSNLTWSFSQTTPEAELLNGKNISLSGADLDAVKEIKQLYLVNSFYRQLPPAQSLENDAPAESFIQYPPDYVRIPDEYAEVKTFTDAVKNVLPLVTLKTINNRVILEIYNTRHNELLQNPLVLVDGIPFSDMDELLKLQAADIKRISVYRSKIFYGDYDFAGIITIETKPGTEAAKAASENSVATVNNFVPNTAELITNQTATTGKKPEFSSLLYWNPEQSLSANENIKITAPDLPGRYRVVVEGFNAEGKPVSISKYFIVKE